MQKLLDYGKGAPPLYYQIMTIEKGKIVNGEYPFHSVMPSEKNLEELYGVSRITVRQAIYELEQDGYVKRIRGKGTQVIYRHKVEEMLMTIKSFSEEMRERGLVPGTKYAHIEIVPTTPNLAELFKCEIGTNLYKLTRVRTADGEPFVVFITYSPIWSNLPLDDEKYYGSFYTLLENLGIGQPVLIDETFSADIAEGEIAELLDQPKGRPIMLRVRKAYDGDGRLMEYTLSYYNGDRYAYKLVAKAKA